jgi:hypothetical protein
MVSGEREMSSLIGGPVMSVSSIGSSGSSSTAQAELLKAQQKLAADVAAKAADKVIAADKAAVTKIQREVAQSRTSTGAVDVDL